MHLIAYDPYANPALATAASVTLYPSLADILSACDFLTIHTPLLASTKGMIGAAELATMKTTSRILNVARGGMIDEEALLEALNAGKIAGAGIDVFTSEPPQPDSSASRLIAHPKVVATPHLGASTVEAQENVSIDVCEQVISILSGQLPRSAVNAPIILPEEYRTLQPYVELVTKMGTLYTQHYSSSKNRKALDFRTTFDLVYEGNLATLTNTKPLFAALIKGLLQPIGGPDLNVNIVNAELVAKERGILVNEARSREDVERSGFQSSITLRARASRAASAPAPSRNADPPLIRGSSTANVNSNSSVADQVIQGFVSANTPYISRLDRFVGNFIPRGTLLIIRNYDSCGKIGFVGSKLGKEGVNIKFMSVAPLAESEEAKIIKPGGQEGGEENEALMILGVDRDVSEEVVQGLVGQEGVLEVGVVTL
jgi:D-3-phosphoglycerate dehydrogenase / 2-oxoglutarate reductase